MIHVGVLPPPQRAFWEEDLAVIPRGWVLYGGTAIALHLGHRQSRDYVDIAALLDSGLTINHGVAALLALCGNQASGLQSVKTIAWFKDGNLEATLSSKIRDQLTRAAASYDPRTQPAAKLSSRLD